MTRVLIPVSGQVQLMGRGLLTPLGWKTLGPIRPGTDSFVNSTPIGRALRTVESGVPLEIVFYAGLGSEVY